VDDDGHLFVSVKGKLVELLPNGKPVRGSKYTGLPAGPIIDVARSFSNFDPQAGPKTLDFVPPELAFPDKPDLTFSAVTAGQFTVRNQGTADAGPFKVSVTNPTGGPPETYSFDGLAEGASVSGTYTCGRERPITVDSDGQVDEGNEGNNGAVTIRC
jgi:hypothetical protein